MLCSLHRHQSNGAVIARCGQPEVSWWGWRNADDEHLVQSVAKACASDSQSNGSKLSTRNSSRDFPNAGDLSDVEFGKVLPRPLAAVFMAYGNLLLKWLPPIRQNLYHKKERAKLQLKGLLEESWVLSMNQKIPCFKLDLRGLECFFIFLAIVTRMKYICNRGPAVSPDHGGNTRTTNIETRYRRL